MTCPVLKFVSVVAISVMHIKQGFKDCVLSIKTDVDRIIRKCDHIIRAN